VATRPLPWRYPYLHDVPRQREVLRPVVSVQLLGAELSSPVKALVDPGSEHVLAAPWLASDAKVDLASPKYEINLGIAGGNPNVRFVDVQLRLLHPDGDDDEYIEWECEVGFPDVWRPAWPVLLGQVGFFDRFTVSMHRAARAVVIEDWDAFDGRWAVKPDEAPDAPREVP
jgi:hypothetical protein